MTDFVYVNDLPEDDTPSADARSLYVNEAGTELVQGPVYGDLSTAPGVFVPALTATGNVTLTGGFPTIAMQGSTQNYLTFSGADGVKRYQIVHNDGNGNFQIDQYSAAGVLERFAFLINSSGEVSMTSATSVSVPTPTATGHALRWGSDASVGALTATGNVEMDSANPYLFIDSTAGAVDQRRFAILNDGSSLKVRSMTDASGTVRNMLAFGHSSGISDFSGSTAVTVPAPTADDHAATKKYVDDAIAAAIAAL